MRYCYIISYDLSEDGDYESLYKALKAYGTWAKITESTWAIVTEDRPAKVRDDLYALMEEGDRLFVVKSGVGAAWRNVRCSNEWLKKNL